MSRGLLGSIPQRARKALRRSSTPQVSVFWRPLTSHGSASSVARLWNPLLVEWLVGPPADASNLATLGMS
jgi:hypothetical protein